MKNITHFWEIIYDWLQDDPMKMKNNLRVFIVVLEIISIYAPIFHDAKIFNMLSWKIIHPFLKHFMTGCKITLRKIDFQRQAQVRACTLRAPYYCAVFYFTFVAAWELKIAIKSRNIVGMKLFLLRSVRLFHGIF